MSESRPSQRHLWTYLLLVFLYSSVFYFLILHAHKLNASGGLYVVGIMWCPALAAFTTLLLNGRPAADLGWKWPARKYAAMSWYIPLLYAGIAYAIVWISGLGGFPNHEFMQGLVGRLGQGLSPAASTVLYVPNGQFGNGAEHGEGAG